MQLRVLLPIVSAVSLFTGAAFGQATIAVSTDNAFQINYASNFQQGVNRVVVINTGARGGVTATPSTGGAMCINVYQFDTAQNMQSCCSCLVAANALANLPVTGGTFTPLVIKLVATVPVAASCATSQLDASFATLASGLASWIDFAPYQAAVPFRSEFKPSSLSAGELATLGEKCNAPGINKGTCTGCPIPPA